MYLDDDVGNHPHDFWRWGQAAARISFSFPRGTPNIFRVEQWNCSLVTKVWLFFGANLDNIQIQAKHQGYNAHKQEIYDFKV
jgi:hypothetical protein